MDIHPWTKYEVAQAATRSGWLVPRPRCGRARYAPDKASEVGGTMRTSSWLDRLRRSYITAQPESAGPVSAR